MILSKRLSEIFNDNFKRFYKEAKNEKNRKIVLPKATKKQD
jgi:hypothetical protein